MSKIYDCFCFFNELDILELRLNILNPVVDYFVISEAAITHTGVSKPFYFEENKERFSNFLHKIIHIKFEDAENPAPDIQKFVNAQVGLFNPLTQPHYRRDFIQKESIRRGLINCQDNDIIISSDCDEIPNPEILKNIGQIINEAKYFSFLQNTYYYHLNMFKETNWKGSRMGKYKDLRDYSFNTLRAQNNYELNNGGWHFSFMGGPDKVKTKIQSYSAQEMNNSHVISSINNNIEKGIDPFFRSTLKEVTIDNTYPKYLLDNIEKYNHMIK